MTSAVNDGGVFFVRHFNDVDHMAPVVWRAAEHMPVRVIVTDESAEANPLVAAFDRHPAIDLVHLRDHVGTATDAEGRAVVESDYSALDLTSLFQGLGTRPVVCFDWDYQPFARRLAETANAVGLTTVSLPHGDAPYVNLMINLGDLTGSLRRIYERADMFDHTVVPNALCADRYRTLPADRLHVLGSPRYCQAWMRQLDEIIPAAPTPAPRATPSHLRVSVFLRNANFPIHWAELVKALEIIKASGPVAIEVKHHTRDKKMQAVLDEFPVLAVGDDTIAIASPDRSSVSILADSDLVVDLGTSIAFEAVLAEKPVLELEHVHPNRSTIAAHLPRTEIRTRDELVAAMVVAHDDPRRLMSEREEVEAFRVAIVEPAGSDVLERYVEFLVGAARMG